LKKLGPDELRSIIAVLDANTTRFVELARIAELRTDKDFCGIDLSDVNFGSDSLSGFNFSRSDVSGANFSQAKDLSTSMFLDALWDGATLWPKEFQFALGQSLDRNESEFSKLAWLGLSDGRVLRWNFKQNLVSVFHQELPVSISGLGVFNGGKKIAVGYANGNVRFVTLHDGNPLAGSADGIGFLAGDWHQNSILAVNQKGYLSRLEDTKVRSYPHFIGEPKKLLKFLTFGDSQSVVLRDDGRLLVFENESFRILFEEHNIADFLIANLFADPIVCSISKTGTVSVHFARSQSQELSLESGKGKVAFLPNGDLLIGVGTSVELWSRPSHFFERVRVIETERRIPTSFAPIDEQRTLIAYYGGGVDLWDLRTDHRTEVRRKSGEDTVRYMEPLPGDNGAIALGGQSSIGLLDLGKPRANYRLLNEKLKRSKIQKISITNDGNSLLIQTRDGVASVWNVATGALLNEFRDPAAKVTAITFPAEGRRPWAFKTKASVSLLPDFI
jgi:WD40 repeat protein